MSGVCVLALLATACLLLCGPGCKNRGRTASTKPAADQADQAAEGAAGAEAASSREVTVNPGVLLDPSAVPGQVELRGVKVGDPASAIPADQTVGRPDASGWINLRDNVGSYRIEDGKVAALHVTGEALLSKLNVQGRTDLTARLGEPDQQIDAGPDAADVTYVYNARGLTFLWNRKANRMAAVTVGS